MHKLFLQYPANNNFKCSFSMRTRENLCSPKGVKYWKSNNLSLSLHHLFLLYSNRNCAAARLHSRMEHMHALLNIRETHYSSWNTWRKLHKSPAFAHIYLILLFTASFLTRVPPKQFESHKLCTNIRNSNEGRIRYRQ